MLHKAVQPCKSIGEKLLQALLLSGVHQNDSFLSQTLSVQVFPRVFPLHPPAPLMTLAAHPLEPGISFWTWGPSKSNLCYLSTLFCFPLLASWSWFWLLYPFVPHPCHLVALLVVGGTLLRWQTIFLGSSNWNQTPLGMLVGCCA